ncbi:MAG TPA: O-antigen ligase family protein [Solirubrobacteraceae bacterium]|nr:O-antigen ligase family protein [Solirubrobacteraceae bacterium]
MARRAVLSVACLALLAGPTALAFFSGGYFETPRVWAGAAAWALVALAMLTGRRPLPASAPGILAVGGLTGYGLWTLASTAWAPVAGSAWAAGQVALLYAGALIAALAFLRDPRAQRLVEPGLALGTAIVVGYGVSNRMLPGLLHFHRSISAQGRLEQPLTYWNAMGELAALGFVLAVRLAGDAARPRALRVMAAAATPLLGLGVYLSVSRGALFAVGAGVVALVVLAPSRAQLHSVGLGLLGGLLASLGAAPFKGVTSLAGPLGTREHQGAIALAILAAVTAAAAIAQLMLARRDRDARLRLPRRAPLIATALVCAGLAGAIVVGSKETSAEPLSAGATRYVSLESNRYAYWGVALKAFAAEPVHGVGAGGWAVWWLRYRTVIEGAQDAHSLELQTLAELGLVGAVLLLAFLGGEGWALVRAARASPPLAAGPAAACITYIVHSPLDWDWQMPAVTLIAIVLGGLLLALAEPAPRAVISARRPEEPARPAAAERA